MIGLSLGLAACSGGDGVGTPAWTGEGTSISSDSTLRLASETTVKPWDATMVPVSALEQASVAPAKTASNAIVTNGAPTGTVSAYDPNALPLAGGTASDSAQWPAWRQSMARWRWMSIPGTDLGALRPDPAVPGALSARIDAWNGLAADTRTSRVFSAANGGHADYSGNEVYQIDLSQDSPRWVMLRAPTAAADIVASDYTKGIFHDYYLDGRPASTHTYYALNFIGSRNAIFKFGSGSLWGSGNEGNWKTDAFSLDANDWQPAGSWPDVVPNSRSGVIGASTCINPLSEEVYVAAPGNLKRFNPNTGQFATLAAWLQNSSEVYARACAVDTRRNRVVFFGDAYNVPAGGLAYDIPSNTLRRFGFSGTDIAEVTRQAYNFAWYDPKIDRFLMKVSASDAVYAIHPETFAVERVATIGGEAMPDAINGVHTRWQQLPKLGGYAYYPRAGSGVWFLATE